MALRFPGYRRGRRCLVLLLLVAAGFNIWFVIATTTGTQSGPSGSADTGPTRPAAAAAAVVPGKLAAVAVPEKLAAVAVPGKLAAAAAAVIPGELAAAAAAAVPAGGDGGRKGDAVRNTGRDRCPYWCSGPPPIDPNITARLKAADTSASGGVAPVYYLTAVVSVRIYDWKDKAELGTDELLQWLRYLSYAGVEHVYLYDAYAFANESQAARLTGLVASGFLTYTDWHHKAVPFSLSRTQAAAYGDCLRRWGRLSAWQLGTDIDEYPFSPVDRDPGFLTRFLAAFEDLGDPAAASAVSELTMTNYLFLGKPLDRRRHPLLVGRLWRRTREAGNRLVKPIYRPAAVKWRDIHTNSLRYGERRRLRADTEVRLNHYWGARLQNWGEDTAEILDRTVVDRGMEPIVENLNRCYLCRPPP